jgi:hypothetical protein
MTKKKRARDARARSEPDAEQLAYRARVDETIAALAAVEGGPHWVRHTRYAVPTYTAIVRGHRLNVWQADNADWRVMLDVLHTEIPIAQVRTPAEGRAAAVAWAASPDPSFADTDPCAPNYRHFGGISASASDGLDSGECDG